MRIAYRQKTDRQTPKYNWVYYGIALVRVRLQVVPSLFKLIPEIFPYSQLIFKKYLYICNSDIHN